MASLEKMEKAQPLRAGLSEPAHMRRVSKIWVKGPLVPADVSLSF